MPQIPVYQSQRNISAGTVAPFRDEASQPFEDQQKVIGALQGITQQWSDANDVMQYTEAKAKYELASADIQARAEADPDFKNSEKYIKELDSVKSESLKGISNQQVGNKLNLEFSYGNKLTAIKLDSGFKQKQIEANKYNLELEILGNYNKKAFAVTEAEKQEYSDRINDSIAVNLSSGLITPEEADTLKKKSQLNAVSNLVYSNPQEAVKKIDDFDLTPEERGKFLDKARLIEKKNKEYAEWQLQQTRTQGTIDLSEALHSKTLTPIMVRDMQQQGTIDSETAAIFDSIATDNKYEIPATTSLAEPDYFIRLLEDSSGDKKQINKILKDAATAYNQHKIGSLQYLYFVQNAKETFDRQSKGIFTRSKRQNNVISALEGIKSFGGAIAEKAEDTGRMILDFFNRLTPESDPQKVKSEVVEEYLDKEIEKSKKEIKAMPVRMISPDGRIFEVLDKNVDKALKKGFKYAR